MSEQYTAIDFVKIRANNIDKEGEYEKADALVEAAALLVNEADAILTGSLPKDDG